MKNLATTKSYVSILCSDSEKIMKKKIIKNLKIKNSIIRNKKWINYRTLLCNIFI